MTLSEALAVRLEGRTRVLGSTLYSMTWKQHTTPAGRQFSRLAVSVPRTSGRDSTGWPTASASDGGRAGTITPGMTGTSLPQAVNQHLRGWPTATANDSIRHPAQDFKPTPNMTLNHTAILAGWVTATTRDWKDSPGMATTREDGRTRLDQLPRQAQLVDSGLMPSGSCARTAKPAQLNPAFSLWLMGYGKQWLMCCHSTSKPGKR